MKQTLSVRKNGDQFVSIIAQVAITTVMQIVAVQMDAVVYTFNFITMRIMVTNVRAVHQVVHHATTKVHVNCASKGIMVIHVANNVDLNAQRVQITTCVKHVLPNTMAHIVKGHVDCRVPHVQHGILVRHV